MARNDNGSKIPLSLSPYEGERMIEKPFYLQFKLVFPSFVRRDEGRIG
jgi:hypothetical protein